MSTKAQPSARIEFIDGLRGIAVVFMIILHTAHGWLTPAVRSGAGWQAITAVGGMAAPLFFLLAGVGVGVRWRPPAPGQTTAHAAAQFRTGVARGLSLVVVGYALRVQMWLLDGPAIAEPNKLPFALALLAAYGLSYGQCTSAAAGEPLDFRRLAAAGASFVLGLWGVSWVEPARVEGLLRVDVLQGIGASLVLLAVVSRGALSVRARAVRAAMLGLAVMACAHAVRSWVPGPLPEALAAYLGHWAPAPGGRPMAMFPLFPWAAYAALGATLGAYWAGQHAAGVRPWRLLALGLFGVVLAATVRETRPDVFELTHRWPALLQPVRVAYRLGLGLAAAPVAWLLCQRASPVRRPLLVLGSHSLLIYCVHLEFAFGTAGTPLRAALGHTGWALAAGGLTAGMCLLAGLKERLPAVLQAPAQGTEAVGN